MNRARQRRVGSVLVLAAALAACGANPPAEPSSARLDAHGAENATRQPSTTTFDPWDVRPVLPEYQPTPTRLAVASPVRLTVPSIGVDTPLVRLGVAPDGTMEVPADVDRAGWFEDGPRPGEDGPAVLAGHVDSTRGPAVFARLSELQPGMRVDVARSDGTSVAFVVREQRRFAKSKFPTQLVFGPTVEAELRLVTCGGVFDSEVGHYQDNVVVFASLA